MKKIYDRPIVMEYVKKYGISRFFDTRDLPFFLIRYEKGETIIHPTEHTRYLQFVVEGTVAIYSIRRMVSVSHRIQR
ncbi:MAG: hypothetical protein ACLVAW_15760 [Eisenbergiella massiliensis]